MTVLGLILAPLALCLLASPAGASPSSGSEALGAGSSCDSNFLPGPECEANLNAGTALSLFNYGTCLDQNTDFCSFYANTFDCELYPIRYTWLLASSICEVSSALHCRCAERKVSSSSFCDTLQTVDQVKANCADILDPSIESCARPIEKVLDAFECTYTNAQALNIALLSIVFLMCLVVTGIRCQARCVRRCGKGKAGKKVFGILQVVDLKLRKWQNLMWRILKIKRSKPLGMISEQLLPLALCSFLVMVVNLKPLEPYFIAEEFGTGLASGRLVLDFKNVLPSTLTYNIIQRLAPLMPLFFNLCYAKFVSNLTADLVRDKENRSTELLKIMGTSSAALNLAWVMTWMLLGIPLSIALPVLLSVGRVYTNADLGALMLFFYAYFLSIICFAQLLQPFFRQSKTASWISVLLWLLFHVLGYSIKEKSLDEQSTWAFLLPQVGFTLGVDRNTAESLLPAIGVQCPIENSLPMEQISTLVVGNSLLMLFLGW